MTSTGSRTPRPARWATSPRRHWRSSRGSPDWPSWTGGSPWRDRSCCPSPDSLRYYLRTSWPLYAAGRAAALLGTLTGLPALRALRLGAGRETRVAAASTEATAYEFAATRAATRFYGRLNARAPYAGHVTLDGVHLSVRQMQQPALARVLLLDPEVVVLDEATAEAGSDAAHTLDRAALAVTEGRTAVVVAHRLSQAEGCDTVLVMEDGRAAGHGSPGELRSRDGVYARLWASWAKGRG
ncbi:ABC transporter ATP-binding protein [Streptomyces sp. NPDC048663]|uniref:ABC transporter ATP-binding protein n=1 Tax=Streptomyces sp. NPDC048663 TaxID=3155638 RepID=UPI00341C1BC5